ncbi:hypothetical protein BM221_003220 [Beauveria bassiana]|uniref:Uncharacterized protein n=1 Tax=Beauveria bassiana TaxID=176275 RepID=A0A2N6NU18_BEABA|nr:hypothetical protein BM221_003220 [Beauveria bassiana]
MSSHSSARPDAPKSSYGSSVPSNSRPNTANQTPQRLRPPRSLPPWIDSYHEKHDDAAADQLRELGVPLAPLHHSPTLCHKSRSGESPGTDT